MNSKTGLNCRPFILIASGIILVVAGFLVGRSSVQSGHPVGVTETGQVVVTNIVVAAKALPQKSEETGSHAAAAAEWSERTWREMLLQPATPARNLALATLIEKVAATNPDQAMVLAQAGNNLKLREQLTLAALHGWARTSALAAANWVTNLPDSGARDAALENIFEGAIAVNPESAIAAAKTLMQQSPEKQISYGARLIDALCQSGNFSIAASWATNGDSGQRSQWLGQAFSKWAMFQPENAAQSAQAISDPEVRNQALHGIVGGWSQADPSGLVQFITQLPAGDDRGEMLGQALSIWARHDPITAVNWINANTQFGADLDQGAAQIATLESIPTQTALSWAETISNPQLRSTTITSVLRDWISSDPSAVKNYLQTTKDLLPEDQQTLANLMTEPRNNSGAQ